MTNTLSFISNNSKKRSGLPPGPRLPSALQAIGWSRRPLPFMERCRRRYGDVFTLRVRHSGTWVVLSDPEDLKRVFTADHTQLGVGVANSLLGPLLGQRSVMLLEEPEHMTRRKIILPSFHGRRIQDYQDVMVELTRREIESWPIDTPFELWPRMQAITLGVVMHVVFGEIDSDHLKRLRGLLKDLTEFLNDERRMTLLAAFGPRWVVGNSEFRSKMDTVEDAVLEEVRRRRSQAGSEERTDAIAMLEEARYEDGSPLSEQDVRDELITLLSDGPTATLLSWAFERLLHHPKKLERLRAEVIAGEEESYLDAVVKETMRLCPSVPLVVRRLRQPMELGGYTIPAGTTVAPCPHLIHRREDLYPKPRSFIPERFLDRPVGNYTWIPFGGGVRRCLAASYAQMEMKEVIRTIAGEVQMRPADTRSERVIRSSIAFAPDRGALVVATGRTPGASKAPQLEAHATAA